MMTGVRAGREARANLSRGQGQNRLTANQMMIKIEICYRFDSDCWERIIVLYKLWTMVTRGIVHLCTV